MHRDKFNFTPYTRACCRYIFYIYIYTKRLRLQSSEIYYSVLFHPNSILFLKLKTAHCFTNVSIWPRYYKVAHTRRTILRICHCKDQVTGCTWLVHACSLICIQLMQVVQIYYITLNLYIYNDKWPILTTCYLCYVVSLYIHIYIYIYTSLIHRL
jgi:hypothetical protein